MSLRWTFSTLGYAEASLADAAALAARFGFCGLEIRALLGRIDLPAVLKDEYETPVKLAQAVAALKMPIVALDSSFRLLDANDEARRELVALGPWADALEVPFLRVFDGGSFRQAHDSAVRQQMQRELEWWETIRQKEGIDCRLMVETHWALADSDDILSLSDECGDSLHLLWDVVHTWEHSGRLPLEDWSRLKSIVRHIHIKDAVRDVTARDGVRMTLPGQGQLPLAELFLALKKDHFAGPVSLEWERFWIPELPDLATALASGRAAGWW